MMRLEELTGKIGAKMLARGGESGVEIARVYAGDRISDLLNEATAETLLVTNLASAQLLRVAQLMDVPALCLLNGVTPDAELLRAAEENWKAVIVSPGGMYETCGRLYECLGPLPKAGT